VYMQVYVCLLYDTVCVCAGIRVFIVRYCLCMCRYTCVYCTVLSVYVQPFVMERCSSQYALVVQLVPEVLHGWLHNVVSFAKYEVFHSRGNIFS
jgi:hypothetical protein